MYVLFNYYNHQIFCLSQNCLAIGTGIGSIVLYLTKLRGRKLALFITVIFILTIPLTPTFLLNCSTLKVAGVTVPYSDRLVEHAPL